MPNFKLLLLSLCFFTHSCAQTQSGKQQAVQKQTTQLLQKDTLDNLVDEDTTGQRITVGSKKSETVFPYNLNTPNARHKLPDKLVEISGLDYMGNGQVVCVNDEKGDVFVYDLTKGEVVAKVDFEKGGDYEGIEWADDKLYILRSDGDLYRVKKFNTEDQKTKKYETPLSTGNDAEGLAYDAVNNRLLVACKGSPGKEESLRGKKAVYAFNLETKEMAEEPAITIDLKNLRNWKGSNKVAETYDKVSEFFTGTNITFNPSGIAVHPISGYIYLIATSGKLLVVLNKAGKEVLHIEKLAPATFKQPEGITFSETGNLIISNEGRGGKANILVFDVVK